MREILLDALRAAVTELFLKASREIAPDIRQAMEAALARETAPAARYALEQLVLNYDCAREDGLPICQDTGMAILFADIGQDVHFLGGDFNEAVQAGVRDAYDRGLLRKSVVDDPLYDRKNTLDNCPAVIHTRIVPGENVHLLAMAKGFGSENMSRIGMLTPASGEEGVFDYIVETVRLAGPNPCPPMIIGVGIGGDFEQAALMAKRCHSAIRTRGTPRSSAACSTGSTPCASARPVTVGWPPRSTSPSRPCRRTSPACPSPSAFAATRPGTRKRPCRRRR